MRQDRLCRYDDGKQTLRLFEEMNNLYSRGKFGKYFLKVIEVASNIGFLEFAEDEDNLKIEMCLQNDLPIPATLMYKFAASVNNLIVQTVKTHD